MDDLKAVRYVTRDPLQNLRIRVTLTRLSAASRASHPSSGAINKVGGLGGVRGAGCGEHRSLGAHALLPNASPRPPHIAGAGCVQASGASSGCC